ncbi:TolC family outer membrane protein [Pseudomonas berkeleyensis]|uniref:TolC family outer membrane protein n=1 Tax=Pseudomonas berkeleyensis TaxID=2726956 RepID=A0A7G5DNJ4_9PSED|nr:TolC family outer membrane protein [Pseudomonas berkeleyensis]QMV63319.1 TolC family outer membrane protein [Pseudomonas berkeleyensis]WSO38776.1 TolC family outer membrane protein [Pseudomonas berkeleyensis]
MSVRLLCLCLLLCCVLPAHALGLLDAYALALRHDPTFQAAIAERDAGLESQAIGRAGLLPRLSWSYSNQRNDSEVTAGEQRVDRDYRSYASVLSLQQPLFDYAAWADYRQGVARTLLADERFRGRSQELAVRLFEAYSQALLSDERIALARAQRRALAERLRLNQRLLQAGEGTRTDALETEARLALAEAELIQAQDDLDVALRALEAIVGEPLAHSDLQPLLDDFPIQPPQPSRFEAWRDLAVAGNADLAAQRRAVDVAAQSIEKQRAGHLPTLSLVASSRLTRSDSESSYNQQYDTDSIGIQLSVPLFAGGGVSAATRQATAAHVQAGFELDAQTAEVLTRLRQQFNLCNSAAARVRAYRLAVSAAQTLVEATRRSVAGGERVNLDVLDAEQQLHSARRDLAEARHGYLRAWLQLRYLAGIFDEQDLLSLAGYFVAERG